jgi:HAMP domain-containing protein
VRDDGVRGGRAVTRMLAGVPLRVRLVAVACCLVAAGAGITGLACSLAARGFLTGQADQELRAYADVLTSRPFTVMPAAPGPGGAADSGFLVEVTGSGSQLVLRAGPDSRPGPAAAGIPVRAGQLAVVPAGSGGGSWLVVTEPVHYSARHIPFTYGYDSFSLYVTGTARPGTAGTLVVGLDLSSVGRVIREITVRCAAAGGAAVLAVAFLGLAVIRAILRPLARMEKAAAGVVAGGLSRQVPDGHPRGEAGGLTQSLSRALSQAGQACNASAVAADAARRSSGQMRAVIADTGRELRRPVSVIRGFAEYYRLRGPLTAGELDRMMGRVADEAARVDALIDDLARTGYDQARPPGDDGSACTDERETDGHTGAGHCAPLPPGRKSGRAGVRGLGAPRSEADAADAAVPQPGLQRDQPGVAADVLGRVRLGFPAGPVPADCAALLAAAGRAAHPALDRDAGARGPAGGVAVRRVGGRPLLVAGLAMQAAGLGWLAAVAVPAVPYPALAPSWPAASACRCSSPRSPTSSSAPCGRSRRGSPRAPAMPSANSAGCSASPSSARWLRRRGAISPSTPGLLAATTRPWAR